MKVNPRLIMLEDRILIAPIEAEDVTPGGIVIPETAKEKPTAGRVLAVGPGKVLQDGRRLEPSVKVGDKVLFSKYACMEVRLDGQMLSIARESDILAIDG